MKTNENKENKRKEIIGKLIEEGIITISLNMDIDEDGLAERAAEIMEAYGDDPDGSFFWKDLTEAIGEEFYENCNWFADVKDTAADVTYKVFGPSDTLSYGDEEDDDDLVF